MVKGSVSSEIDTKKNDGFCMQYKKKKKNSQILFCVANIISESNSPTY